MKCYLVTTVEELRHQNEWASEDVLRHGHVDGMQALLHHCHRRRLQAVQRGHTILQGVGPHVPPRYREQRWVPVPVLERGDGRLHTHIRQDVTSVPQRRMLQHHEATEVVAGASQGAKLHVCGNVGGGDPRYLGTRDGHRGSKTVELWVRTIFCALLIRPRYLKKFVPAPGIGFKKDVMSPKKL